ncbi:MAG: Gfo/Idh/MocA family oxidoreductase, partial [Clostridia bacterium]|nr:Gfo/Idh/MocA family oxidoreductase [Clostridia bacterium]
MKTIRLGLFGLGRGSAFYKVLKALDGELVAVCERYAPRCKEAKEFWGDNLAVYDNFDDFINHDMDAVFLCNCFHEHAPYAIKCMEKGIPVLSECTAAGTLADAVELVRAYEKYGTMYMLSENYPFMLFNQEMRKVFRGGSLGELLYAEGEYNHPSDNPPGSPTNNDIVKYLRPYEKHWRNYLPRTYYLTHSLAPLMWITGKTPRKVTAMPIYKPHLSRDIHNGDVGAIMLLTNDDNSVFRVTGNVAFGAREDSYRICGTKGQIENVRKEWNGDNEVVLNYTKWAVPEGMSSHNRYIPKHETEADRLEAEKAGHGGGDYYVIKEFFRCIRENVKPEMDVYFATTMAAVGILGFRSILENRPFDIPDFKNE